MKTTSFLKRQKSLMEEKGEPAAKRFRQSQAEREQAESEALEAEIQALQQELDGLPSVEDMENEIHQLQAEIGEIEEIETLYPDYLNRFSTRKG